MVNYNFRTDINFLRAVAILGVLIYHIEPLSLQGGFAGVDVFFVISGFLMTSIIFKQNRNDFSLIYFYKARFRRIVPPLIPVLSLLILVSYFLLPPSDTKELSTNTLGTLGFVSNILYWRDVGYFDGGAKENWLLHTWSLSVEWQFYIVFPIAISFLRRVFSEKNVLYIILVLVILSYTFVSMFGHLKPVANFYLLPTSRAGSHFVNEI